MTTLKYTMANGAEPASGGEAKKQSALSIPFIERGLEAITRYDTNALRDWLTDRGIASPEISNEPPSFERHVVAVSAEIRRLLRNIVPASGGEHLRTAVLAAIDDEPEPSEESGAMPPEVLYALRNAPEAFVNTVVVVTKRNIRARVLAALDTPTDTTSGGEREALRAENERLRKALEEIDQMAPVMEPEYDDWGGDTEAAENYGRESGLWDAGQIARAALDAHHLQETDR